MAHGLILIQKEKRHGAGTSSIVGAGIFSEVEWEITGISSRVGTGASSIVSGVVCL